MTWVKLHTDILSDPKLMRAARRGSQSLFLLPWLIVFAKHAADGGRLSIGEGGADPEDIATMIPNIKPRQVAQCIAALTKVGVLTPDPDGVPRFTRWADRAEKPSESRSAWRERKQKSRDVPRDNGGTSRDVKHESRESHATEVEVEVEVEQRREETTGDNALKALSPRKGEMGEKENGAARDRTDRDIARKRAIAKRWSAAHPEELVVIEQLVDRDMTRFKGSPAVVDEIRKGKILAEILKRANGAPLAVVS